ncbi:TPA: hypothetical protein HA278_06385 [Candidatus Woesearchaeota archaeon]|nr:hypothetical protein [archaeon]HIJ11659.1 hypothetical protein [Candidatus Woesearchaeota archaeon]|tara:strand:+ start:1141 stop:2118 length:978 start_codon:yes stop_codon:yes gene_type:complete
MKKILFMIFAMISLCILVGCVPEEVSNEEIESLSDAELDLAMQKDDQALVGNAKKQIKKSEKKKTIEKVRKAVKSKKFPLVCKMNKEGHLQLIQDDKIVRTLIEQHCSEENSFKRVCVESGYESVLDSKCNNGCDESTGECNPAPVFRLEQCGDPIGGWQDGATYFVDSPIQMEEDDLDEHGTGACFHVKARDVTIDCQGNNIRGIGRGAAFWNNPRNGGVGVAESDLWSMHIVDCDIRNFFAGVQSYRGDDSVENSVLTDNADGVLLVHGGIELNGNFICGNSYADLECAPSPTNAVGVANTLGEVRNCVENFLERGYVACPEE